MDVENDHPPEAGIAYTVVRVGDEIVVDLMKSACGIDYAEASLEIDYHEINGVRIPFASPRLLWRMKVKTHREKDAADLFFLRRLLNRPRHGNPGITLRPLIDDPPAKKSIFSRQQPRKNATSPRHSSGNEGEF